MQRSKLYVCVCVIMLSATEVSQRINMVPEDDHEGYQVSLLCLQPLCHANIAELD